MTAKKLPRDEMDLRAGASSQIVTARAHVGYVGVDARWIQLLADTTDLNIWSLVADRAPS